MSLVKVKYTEQQKEENELKGRELYRINGTLRDVANVMEHPEFRTFIDKYFCDPMLAQSILMFLKVYELAEESDPNLTPFQKIAALDSAMANPDARNLIHAEFIKWRNDGQTDIRCIKPIEKDTKLTHRKKMLTIK